MMFLVELLHFTYTYLKCIPFCLTFVNPIAALYINFFYISLPLLPCFDDFIKLFQFTFRPLYHLLSFYRPWYCLISLSVFVGFPSKHTLMVFHRSLKHFFPSRAELFNRIVKECQTSDERNGECIDEVNFFLFYL